MLALKIAATLLGIVAIVSFVMWARIKHKLGIAEAIMMKQHEFINHMKAKMLAENIFEKIKEEGEK